LNQRLDCAAFAKYLVDVFLNSNVVQLPTVDVIGVQQLQRNIQVLKRGFTRSLFGLGCNKNLVPTALKSLS